MSYVNSDGFVERKTKSGRRNPHGRCTTRDWWLIKYHTYSGRIKIDFISFPKHMIGKKIKLKVEVQK